MLALQEKRSSGAPRSRFHLVVDRITDRFGPQVAQAYITAIIRLQAGIDEAELASAVASGNLDAILSAVRPSRLATIFAGRDSLSEMLQRTGATTGLAGADILEDALGLAVGFNRVDPNVVMFARERAARLVVQVAEDVREAIRIVVATGAAEGLTTVQQARAIREIVGLPPNWAAAPSNLGRELRAGRFTTTRRLSAIDKARIGKRLREGTVTEEFIAEMEGRYARSLTNRRALNIARQETQESAMHGLRESWKQADEQGVLPTTTKRVAIVTPDDRLRPEHAAVPGMNPDGVGLDEPYDTPWGPQPGPPWPADPHLCRCSEGLLFPSGGVL